MDNKPKRKVLILDGDHKNTLAIVRHLGKKREYLIDVVSYNKNSISFFSKYRNQTFVISKPSKDPDKYIGELLKLLESGNYLAIIPVSYISFQICSEHKREILKHTHITISRPEHIYIASSKVKTYQLAEKLGVPYPKIQLVDGPGSIEGIEATYPCVIKGPHEAGKNIVEYANNKNELISKYRGICEKNDFKGAFPIVQDYIQGEGVGFFAFYKEGKCVNYFMHKRIREYPVSGGASTVAESFYDERVFENGKKMLDALHWEGVAMVEFKKDNRTGVYNLMEINAKFWGSLDLALVSGVNFPQMLIDNACNKPIEKLPDFGKKRFQWLLNGDLFHALEKPSHIFAFFKDLFFAENDFYFTDIKPNLFQILYIPVHYYKKWFK